MAHRILLAGRNLFWTLAVLIFAAALCCPASAQTLVITDAGYFTLETDDAGVPRVSEIESVLDLRGDAPKPPDPEDPDEPDPNEQLTKRVQKWAEEVGDPQTSQKLALIYLQIAEAVKAGDLDLETGPEALADAGDAVLTGEKAAKWSAFRESVGEEFRIRRARGTISSEAHLVAFLKAVADGLELSADGSVAVSQADLLRVISQVNAAITRAK